MPGQSGSLKEPLRLFEGAVLEALDFSRGRVHGTRINANISYKKLRLLEKRKPLLVAYV